MRCRVSARSAPRTPRRNRLLRGSAAGPHLPRRDGRGGTLLAFPGILATLSTTAARDAHGSVLIFVGIIALIAAAGLFFAGIVWFNLDTTPRFRKLADV
jgi:hypothetical protein